MRVRKESWSWVAGWAAALALLGCRGTLQGGLEEGEANEVLVVLAQAGLEGVKTGGGRSGHVVEVASQDLAPAWRALQAAGLPRPRHQGFQDVFQERALVPGPAEEQALYLAALQEELARTLEEVEGVLAARVHVAGQRLEPAVGALGRASPAAPTAAVLLLVRDGEPQPIQPQAVQVLLANAVEGLSPERVSVVVAPRRLGLQAGSTPLAEPAGGGFPWRLLSALLAGLTALGCGVLSWRVRRRPAGRAAGQAYGVTR